MFLTFIIIINLEKILSIIKTINGIFETINPFEDITKNLFDFFAASYIE